MKKAKEFDIQKLVVPFLSHLLKPEMKFPLLFLLKCKLTTKSFQKSLLEKGFAPDVVDYTSKFIWLYINTKKKLGAEKTFEIMKATVLVSGLADMILRFDTVNKGRSFKEFVDHEMDIINYGPPRHNEIKITKKTEDKFECVVTKCMFYEISKACGVPEAVKCVCQVDHAIFNAYMPEELTFTRGNPVNTKLSDGFNEGCRFFWELKKSNPG